MKTEKSTFNYGKHSELNLMITIQTHLLITTNLNQNLQINKVKNLLLCRITKNQAINFRKVNFNLKIKENKSLTKYKSLPCLLTSLITKCNRRRPNLHRSIRASLQTLNKGKK
jgi:hypothetical protein